MLTTRKLRFRAIPVFLTDMELGSGRVGHGTGCQLHVADVDKHFLFAGSSFAMIFHWLLLSAPQTRPPGLCQSLHSSVTGSFSWRDDYCYFPAWRRPAFLSGGRCLRWVSGLSCLGSPAESWLNLWVRGEKKERGRQGECGAKKVVEPSSLSAVAKCRVHARPGGSRES